MFAVRLGRPRRCDAGRPEIARCRERAVGQGLCPFCCDVYRTGAGPRLW